MIVELAGFDDGVQLHSQLVGIVNATNVAAAYLAARAVGVPVDRAKPAIAGYLPPRGRFELVEAGQPFFVVVDDAHTPDALTALIHTTRSLLDGCSRRIHVVVGARGGRDRFKRPQIGKIAASADDVVFTADSPGREDPHGMID